MTVNPKFQNKEIKKGLYIVPTPIGNLGDISLRALKILSSLDVIFCEDTRMTKKLLKSYDIKPRRLLVYNDHSNQKQIPLGLI